MAVADKELLGKILKQGEIEFEVSESFYKGEEISKESLREKLHEFGNVNLVGEKAVSIALEEKLASKESVKEIQGVKHLQIFMV